MCEILAPCTRFLNVLLPPSSHSAFCHHDQLISQNNTSFFSTMQAASHTAADFGTSYCCCICRPSTPGAKSSCGQKFPLCLGCQDAVICFQSCQQGLRAIFLILSLNITAFAFYHVTSSAPGWHLDFAPAPLLIICSCTQRHRTNKESNGCQSHPTRVPGVMVWHPWDVTVALCPFCDT